MSTRKFAKPYMPPVRGLVVNYWYVWSWQSQQQQPENQTKIIQKKDKIHFPEPEKNRPCMIISEEAIDNDKDYRIHVIPMTHIPQKNKNTSIVLDLAEQQKLHLPDRTWIKTNEANFIPRWSKTDCLEFLNDHSLGEYGIYGQVERERFAEIRNSINRNRQQGQFKTIKRQEIDPNSPEFRKGRSLDYDREK